MKLLLDTHIALWLAMQRHRLSAREIEALSSPTALLAVSAVSLWEMRIKWSSVFHSGDRKLGYEPREVLAVLGAGGVEFVPLLPDQAVAMLDEPLGHGDPFDELLLVQAQRLDMRLLTRDEKLLGHPKAYRFEH